MAIISVQYVEIMLEKEFTSDEALKCAQLIDDISEYIDDQTGEEFSNANAYPDGPPSTLQGVACRAVIRGMMSDPTNLKTLTVGDVTESYGGLLDFPEPDLSTLATYGAGLGTMFLRHDCD